MADYRSGGGYAPRRPDTQRKRMLDIRREAHFRYDLKQLLLASKMDEHRRESFVATVVSKGSRFSTNDAKEFVAEKAEEAGLTPKERDAIQDLLDRYSKWR